MRERVFEPFFTTKTVGQGSGLGLDIAYRIVVAQHHGDITIRSSPGDTVFTVRLPIAGVDDTADQATDGLGAHALQFDGHIDDAD
jgi:signal transduction histidine kinase